MPADPLLWMEEVEGEEAQDSVRYRNDDEAAHLAQAAELQTTKQRTRSVLDSDEKLPAVAKIGDYYHNFWRDETHERGIWRRTTLDSYRSAEPEWETVLDIDALKIGRAHV